MKPENEIVDRLKNYKENFKLIRSKKGELSVRSMIAELEWVLEVGGKGR